MKTYSDKHHRRLVVALEDNGDISITGAITMTGAEAANLAAHLRELAGEPAPAPEPEPEPSDYMKPSGPISSLDD